MLEIAAIDHIVLRTAQLDKMLAFYCDVLGCHIERTTEPELGLTQLRAGNALIDIVTVDGLLGRKGGEASSGQGNNLDHFCLQLQPIEPQQILDHLSAHGIELGDFEKRYGAQGYGPSLYIQDPDGNTVELKSQLPGIDAESP